MKIQSAIFGKVQTHMQKVRVDNQAKSKCTRSSQKSVKHKQHYTKKKATTTQPTYLRRREDYCSFGPRARWRGHPATYVPCRSTWVLLAASSPPRNLSSYEFLELILARHLHRPSLHVGQFHRPNVPSQLPRTEKAPVRGNPSTTRTGSINQSVPEL